VQIRMLQRSAGVILCVLLAACGGGGATIPNASQKSLGEPSAASGQLQASISTHVVPEYQPSPNPNEELIILSVSCMSGDGLGGECGEPNAFTSTINRYSLSSGSPLSSINLVSGVYGGALKTIVSAGDQYFLSREGSPDTNQVEVDDVNGNASFIPKDATLLMSTDLSTALLVRDNGITVYRAPFTSPSRTAPAPANYFNSPLATNSNGSQVFTASANGSTMTAAIESLITGATTSVTWNTNQSVDNTAAYDARHAWYYFESHSGTTYRIQIVDTAHQKYLGYLNLVGAPAAISVDPTSSDLYVSIANKIYVYNVGACGCASVRRTLGLPFTSAFVTIDRNNQHLIAWTQTYNTLGTLEWEFADLNPQTGAVQRTYPSINSDYTFQYSVFTVLAQ
jgi:hypothetical protein